MRRSLINLVAFVGLVLTSFSLVGCNLDALRPNINIDAQCSAYSAQLAFINESQVNSATVKVVHKFPNGTDVVEEPIYLGTLGSGYNMYVETFPAGQHYEFVVLDAKGQKYGSQDMIIPAGCPTEPDDSGHLHHHVIRVNP